MFLTGQTSQETAMAWALQDAKAKFSEVVKRAQTEGPQEVTVRGEPTVVVLSKADFDRRQPMTDAKHKMSLEEFLLQGEAWPDWFVDIVNDRSKDPSRDLDF